MSFVDRIILASKHVPFVSGMINRLATNRICNRTTARPRAFSLWSHEAKPQPRGAEGPVGEYTSWPMLVDRLYSARHLPPADQAVIDALPSDEPVDMNPASFKPGQVTALFERASKMKTDRSTHLFMYFAQWFTDSILRVDPTDRRKNTSNHNIDLCQIYGLREETARLLRSGTDGKLTSQIINGEEFPDYLGEIIDGIWRVKDKYKNLPYASDQAIKTIFGHWPEERKEKLYATGLERGNSSVGYVSISTLFLREHNRICDELKAQNSQWDDERLFQTARMINTVLLMKLVVQDYINHIAGKPLFDFDPTFAEKQDWYRTPWIALEFDLLYRWHGLVPDTITIAGETYGHQDFRVNNSLLESVGLAGAVTAASSEAAGKIGLKNVPSFLMPAEYAMIKMGRDFRLQSYNAYRMHFGLDALPSFDELTDDPDLRDKLKNLYANDINAVEFVIGLFAQKRESGPLFGDLLNAMVAYDAFTQIYTNPLLSKNVYTPATYTPYGLEVINQTNTVQDLVDRNVGSDPATARFQM